LYARHLNARYTTGFNPCRFIIATNGLNLLAGYWDQERPLLDLKTDDLKIGTKAADDLLGFCNVGILQTHARTYFSKIPLLVREPSTFISDRQQAAILR